MTPIPSFDHPELNDWKDNINPVPSQVSMDESSDNDSLTCVASEQELRLPLPAHALFSSSREPNSLIQATADVFAVPCCYDISGGTTAFTAQLNKSLHASAGTSLTAGFTNVGKDVDTSLSETRRTSDLQSPASATVSSDVPQAKHPCYRNDNLKISCVTSDTMDHTYSPEDLEYSRPPLSPTLAAIIPNCLLYAPALGPAWSPEIFSTSLFQPPLPFTSSCVISRGESSCSNPDISSTTLPEGVSLADSPQDLDYLSLALPSPSIGTIPSNPSVTSSPISSVGSIRCKIDQAVHSDCLAPLKGTNAHLEFPLASLFAADQNCTPLSPTTSRLDPVDWGCNQANRSIELDVIAQTDGPDTHLEFSSSPVLQTPFTNTRKPRPFTNERVPGSRADIDINDTEERVNSECIARRGGSNAHLAEEHPSAMLCELRRCQDPGIDVLT